MRALISDTSAISEFGFAPTVTLERGIDQYLTWIETQGEIRDYFTSAERKLKRRQIVKSVSAGEAR